MQLKKAQKIADKIEAEIGIDISAYKRADLVVLNHQLERFLDLNIETEELSEPNNGGIVVEAIDEDEDDIQVEEIAEEDDWPSDTEST